MTAFERATQDRLSVLAAAEHARTRDVFSLTTGLLRAVTRKGAGGADDMILEAPASSTCIDLMGDRMSLGCLQSMQIQARGMTTWLNHSYDIPEDVCGTIERAWIEEATDPAQGQVHDLWIRTVVDPDAERAVKAWQHIKNGRKFGFSIGGFIKDWAFEDNDGDYCFVINDLELFEVSVVGIPANQRAQIDGVATASLDVRGALLARSLRAKKGVPATPEERALKAAAALVRSVDEVGGAEEITEPAPAVEPAPDEETGAGGAEEIIDDPAPTPAADPKRVRQKPGGLPAFNGISFGVGALRLEISNPSIERSELVLRDAIGNAVATLAVQGGRVIKSGRTISAATREKLQAVKKCVTDAIEHGGCGEVTKKLNDANDGLDEIISADDTEDETGLEEAGIRAGISAARDRLEALCAQIGALEDGRQKMLDENAWLEQLIGRARTTSAGRVTQSTPAAIVASTDPEARRRPRSAVLSDLSHALASHEVGDARTRSLA